MKVTLKSNSTVSVNGIELGLGKGTEVTLPCQSPQEALEMCAIAKLSVDLSYTEGGKAYIAGAAGKFIEKPAKKAPKKAKVVEVVDTPKVKAVKPKK